MKILVVFLALSSANQARFWKNFGLLAEKTEKIPVDTIEEIQTMYEYPVSMHEDMEDHKKYQIMKKIVQVLVDDGFSK